jgi:hypothetical protein
MALLDDLQKTINTLEEFKMITFRVLNYIPEVISSTKEDKGYIIIESLQGTSQKYARPYNSLLFISDPQKFHEKFTELEQILEKLTTGELEYSEEEYNIVDRVTYTIQQSFGIALDLLGNQNANRKHVGNRFEELIRLLVTAIGIKNKKVVLKIPYEENGIYSCETDFVFSPHGEVKSNNETIDEREIVVSLKTSSKDRMGKIFIDKILMSRFVKRDVKVLGVFLNDIQRKEQDKVSYTFVAGLFMVYTNFLTKLDGVYYVDPPPNAKKEPYNKHIKKFSQFLLEDAYGLLDWSS